MMGYSAAPLAAALHRVLLGVAIASAFACASGGGAAGTELRKLSLPQLAEIVKADGYGSVESLGDHVRFKADGRGYALYLYPDGDLQLYYGISGVTLTASDINVWNREFRLSRAYLGEHGDPILESDLLANAGLNEAIVSEFIRVFIGSSLRYRQFVAEHDRGDTVPAAPPASPRT